MFTGIITSTGTVKRTRINDGVLRLQIEDHSIAHDLKKGDSVSVNGTCLTAVSCNRKRFDTEVVAETLARTTLGDLKRGSAVNLELAARPTDRLGGHIVQGHVDGTARAVRVETSDGFKRMWWDAPDDVVRYLVVKGSVAVDGVSLTVADVGSLNIRGCGHSSHAGGNNVR